MITPFLMDSCYTQPMTQPLMVVQTTQYAQAPVYVQPQYVQPPAPQYAQPVMGQPVMQQPVMQQPQYGQTTVVKGF